MNTITVAQAMAMMAECFMEPLEHLTPELSRESVPGWDSMGALSLMAELDERFNIERTLNLSSFQAGVYILKVSGDNVNYTQKLVKN